MGVSMGGVPGGAYAAPQYLDVIGVLLLQTCWGVRDPSANNRSIKEYTSNCQRLHLINPKSKGLALFMHVYINPGGTELSGGSPSLLFKLRGAWS